MYEVLDNLAQKNRYGVPPGPGKGQYGSVPPEPGGYSGGGYSGSGTSPVARDFSMESATNIFQEEFGYLIQHLTASSAIVHSKRDSERYSVPQQQGAHDRWLAGEGLHKRQDESDCLEGQINPRRE